MKFRYLLAICACFTGLNAASPEDIEAFLSNFSGPAYQDLLINNQSLREGTDICDNRYKIIAPLLQEFDTPFTVLDIGAAQGYFSFRIAHDFPQSTCVMIGSNSNYYGNHGDMLYHLCHLNNHLDNIIYLNKLLSLPDLIQLKKLEHFDVILALLVIHQIEESLGKRIAVIETLLSLGDHVVIEVSNDVAPDLIGYVEFLSKKIQCKYLGEVRRHYNPESQATGKFFCFSKKSSTNKNPNRQGISQETFSKFNGVYP